MAAMSNERDGRGGGAAPRFTPYELVFGAGAFESDHFPAIQAEVELRGWATPDPEAFLTLSRVTSLLQEMAPDDAGADVYGRYGLMLYQAWTFWRFGRRLLVLESSVARKLVETFPVAGIWELTPPHPAGYVQLPRNLFWARIEESATPEPVDGFFWTMVGRSDPEAPPYDRLDVLLILGMRPGRPGFGLVPVSAELHGAPLGHWADADARPGGEDFSNILPGGELQGWYALVTELEVLKLTSRIFWHLAVNPDALGEPEQAEGSPSPSPHTFPPSALPFRRIHGAGDG